MQRKRIMDTPLIYINMSEHEVKENKLWWQKKGLMYTSSGYGSKIPTRQMLKFKGRWYRIYCIIYSNCGSIYIISKGVKYYIREYA
jgi:hypothetical protein